MALMTRSTWRWAVPGAVVAIALGAVAVTSATAGAPPELPPRTAAELLVDVQTAQVAGFSGTIVQTADLGLPDLPVQVGGRGSADFTSLVSGTHTLRVWYAGPDRQRLALLGTFGESDLVRNGTDAWSWSSDDNTATHYQLPPSTAHDDADLPGPEAAMTPQEAADAALAAIDPSTTVTTDGTAEVAGRAAYELVLSPKDTASLVGQVRIAVDAEQHLPLRVQVLAHGSTDPAFEVGFSQLSFDVPGDEQFQFTPPPGATVTESTLGQDHPQDTDQPPTAPAEPTAPDRPTAEPTVVGTGWTSVLVAQLPADGPSATDGTGATGAPDDTSAPGDAGGSAGSSLDAVLNSLPTVSGDWGSGRLLQSALFSVLITDDGRVLAGAVPPELLYQAAAR